MTQTVISKNSLESTLEAASGLVGLRIPETSRADVMTYYEFNAKLARMIMSSDIAPRLENGPVFHADGGGNSGWDRT
jgi:hypothetical protein